MIKYRLKITVPFEAFAKRNTDFAWMIKVDGIWRLVQDEELVSIKVEI